MRKHNQKRIIMVVAIMALFLPGQASAGNLEPSGPPGTTQYTLEELYDLISQINTTISAIQMENNRFTDLGDGTVRDNQTSLIWLKDAGCMGLGTYGGDIGNLADGQCGLSDGSSVGDWRLPTKEEFEAFTCNAYRDPAVCNTEGTGQWTEGDPFSNVNWIGRYWTGSDEFPVNGVSDYNKVYVELSDGTFGSIWGNNPMLLWPVRQKQ